MRLHLYQYIKLAWDRSLAMQPPGMGFSMSLGARMFLKEALCKGLVCVDIITVTAIQMQSHPVTTQPLYSVLAVIVVLQHIRRTTDTASSWEKNHENLPLPPQMSFLSLIDFKYFYAVPVFNS